MNVYDAGPSGAQPPLFPTAPAIGASTIGDTVVAVGDGDGVGAGDAVGAVVGAADGDGEAVGPEPVGVALGALDGGADGEAVGAGDW